VVAAGAAAAVALALTVATANRGLPLVVAAAAGNPAQHLRLVVQLEPQSEAQLLGLRAARGQPLALAVVEVVLLMAARHPVRAAAAADMARLALPVKQHLREQLDAAAAAAAARVKLFRATPILHTLQPEQDWGQSHDLHL
jgi:hypothetical protein